MKANSVLQYRVEYNTEYRTKHMDDVETLEHTLLAKLAGVVGPPGWRVPPRWAGLEVGGWRRRRWWRRSPAVRRLPPKKWKNTCLHTLRSHTPNI